MNNFFLLNEAIDLSDYNQFKTGMLELNTIETSDDDCLLKHESVWTLKIIMNNLFSHNGQEEQVVIKFIEQIRKSDAYFSSCDKFDQSYPDKLNAFIGIDFSITGIDMEKQITENTSFHRTKRNYYSKHLRCRGDKNKIINCLSYLYQNYKFEDGAINDVTYWNQYDPVLYSKLHELLIDIPDNPFQGGIGKTEVLKNQGGIASKRLNDEHRITYQLEKDNIRIIRCKEHYG
ncbi:hypothetical protein FACS1894145_0950 [Bacteroidia bacterium]|nr:hypothetical protein FACS1894145_0950 [Bacteroidia bacterium]